MKQTPKAFVVSVPFYAVYGTLGYLMLREHNGDARWSGLITFGLLMWCIFEVCCVGLLVLAAIGFMYVDASSDDGEAPPKDFTPDTFKVFLDPGLSLRVLKWVMRVAYLSFICVTAFCGHPLVAVFLWITWGAEFVAQMFAKEAARKCKAKLDDRKLVEEGRLAR